MMQTHTRLAVVGGLVVALGAGVGCDNPPPRQTYYQRNIEPILIESCSRGTGGCHDANDEDPHGFAAGNFDVTSFELVQKRRDLLTPAGAYQDAPLLIKAVGSRDMQVFYDGVSRPLEIAHNGATIAPSSPAFFTLSDWLRNGATESGVPPRAPPQPGQGDCSDVVPPDFDATAYLDNEFFADFRDNVQPVLASCNAGSCHGAPQADFHITCGDDDDQLAFNFSQAWAFVAEEPDNSQILQVPLALSAGGRYHTGGEQYASRVDPRYLAVHDWAEQVGPLTFGEGDPAKQFFADNVQPLLLTRGCSFQACHSPQAGNDLKLRSGGQSFFSAVALERNYDLLKSDFMAFEYADARRGRAVAKTIVESIDGTTTGGIPHRGGAVLETPGSGGPLPENCAPVYDPATASAFCTLQEWVDLERTALIVADEVSPMDAGDTLPLVYVDRQASHVAGPLEFDTYQPDSDLLVADVTLGPLGAVESVGAARSLLESCPGATDRSVVDVRAPDVRRDGTTIAFAMRTSSADPLGIYTVDLDGTGCTRLTPAAPDQDGLKIHDFDPAWSPDGDYLVFASTRGTDGPSVSRQLFLPQSDLWRMDADGARPEQLTFLSNSELGPQFMREGRISMTTEKVSDGFYQLSGRRINWDGTDYHPLLAQRADSPYADPDDPTAVAPSVDYQQATDIREGSNSDFLLILSDAGARGGAGTLAIFNRSIGPFEAGRTDDGYLASMRIVDDAATGRVGADTDGAYRNPSTLPDGRIMVSYAAFSGDLGTATSLDWDIVAIDPRSGERTVLVGGAGAQVDAVLGLKYPARSLYFNRRQLVFGGGVDTSITGDSEHAVIHMPDAPTLFTLLTGNLRRGRPVDLFRPATEIAIYTEGKAPAGTTSGDGPGGIFQERTLLGTVPLASDGSAKIKVPSATGVILELRDGSGAVVTMGEEHQLGPGETVSMGVVEELFDAVCGACHGSISGNELDVAVTPDALTGASQSLSRDQQAQSVGN